MTNVLLRQCRTGFLDVPYALVCVCSADSVLVVLLCTRLEMCVVISYVLWPIREAFSKFP